MFRILLDNGHETLGYTAGKMRRYRIRIFLGDRVRVELSPTISIEGASSTGTGRHTRPPAASSNRKLEQASTSRAALRSPSAWSPPAP
jgi:hypothetical protein